MTVSFDPFALADNAAFAIDAPLFAVVIVAAMLGVVAGAFATWLSQGRHRRASRQSRAEADKWRAEAQTLKAAQPLAPRPEAHLKTPPIDAMRVFSAEISTGARLSRADRRACRAMRGGFVAPHRHHHPVQRAGEPVATHLLMPAWTESASRAGLYLGVKIVNVFPGNAARGLAAVNGVYVLRRAGRARRWRRSTGPG